MTQVADMNLSIWSDLHKDVYGCRPHMVEAPATNEAYRAEMERLGKLLAIDQEYERQGEIRSQYLFERQLQYWQRREGLTFQRAFLRIAELQQCVNDWLETDDGIDFEHMCYCLGIPYSMEAHLRHYYRGELH